MRNFMIVMMFGVLLVFADGCTCSGGNADLDVDVEFEPNPDMGAAPGSGGTRREPEPEPEPEPPEVVRELPALGSPAFAALITVMAVVGAVLAFGKRR